MKDKMKKNLLLLLGIILLNACTTTTDSNSTKTTTVVPLPPTNLTGKAISTTETNLSWTDNSTNELGFKIERKSGLGSYSVVGTTNTNELIFNDSNLSPNTAYTYRVYAYNNTGNSLTYSNEITVTTNTPITLPTLTTTIASSITGNSAVSGGNITFDGGATITARGIVWNTSTNPTIANNKTVDGIGIGTFTSNLQNLTSATTVYLRAYATNSIGTSYGNEISFTTKNVNLGYGLIAYYPFDGNANDTSTNGNNGIISNVIQTNDRNGITNSAYEFNGVNSRILVSNSVSLNPESITICGWYNMYQLPTGLPGQSGDVALVNKWYQGLNCLSNSDTYSIEIANSNNNPVLIGATSNYTGTSFYSNTNTISNSWQFFTFTHDKITGGKLYLNGVQVSSNSLGGAICRSTNPLYIGADNNRGNLWRFFKGKIDDIGIWNRALTQDEITALYNGQKP
jgi:chitodextrinase